MASLSSRYALEGGHPLIDVTVTTVAAGKTHTTTLNGNQVSNSQGVSQTTQLGATLVNASNQTTQSGGVAAIRTLTLTGAFADATDLFVIPPIDAAGKAVDCEIRPRIDGQPLEQHFNASAGLNDNLFPLPSATVGAYHVRIGQAWRKALRARMANLPLKATGWKAQRSIQFDVYSNIGFGVAAVPTTPLRIIVTGDKMDSAALALMDEELQAILQQAGKTGYDPFSFVDKVPGFPVFTGRHVPPGAHITPETWTAGPNGPAQVGTVSQIYRFVRQAYPNQATNANNAFFLSKSDAVGGASDNVYADINDLGFDLTSDKTRYLRLDLLGLRGAVNQAFAGVKVDEQVLPTVDGQPLTSGVNLYPSGEVQPMRSDSSVYFPFGKSPWPVVARGNKVAWFVTPDGTAMNAEFSATPTLQDSPQVAVGGIEVLTSTAA